jgi:hypothetical protein
MTSRQRLWSKGNWVDHDVFVPRPNLTDEVDRNTCESEIEEGVLLDSLNVGAVLEVATKNRVYRVEICAKGQILISGHPKYCPDPVPVKLVGSTWGRSMVKLGFIGRATRLEFRHPVFGVVLTSRIKEMRELPSK